MVYTNADRQPHQSTRQFPMKTFTLTINKKPFTLTADPDMPLLWAIRDLAGLTGTKFGCGMGLCGACTVHLDGEPIQSCQTTLSLLRPGQKITTIEGISAHADHPVQQAWVEHQVPQCGYCQSGQIMSAVALLKAHPHPTDTDIDDAMAGNLCRCGTYQRIRAAIHTAANAPARPAAKPIAKPTTTKKIVSTH
jgi:isoquinoline 1-oxidoreductase subunit alpha